MLTSSLVGIPAVLDVPIPARWSSGVDERSVQAFVLDVVSRHTDPEVGNGLGNGVPVAEILLQTARSHSFDPRFCCLSPLWKRCGFGNRPEVLW